MAASAGAGASRSPSTPADKAGPTKGIRPNFAAAVNF
jgi:hypothetical protein